MCSHDEKDRLVSLLQSPLKQGISLCERHQGLHISMECMCDAQAWYLSQICLCFEREDHGRLQPPQALLYNSSLS